MGVILGTKNLYGERLVEIQDADRRRHVHVLGQTGSGKTTLLRNMMIQDIEEGRGVGFIDPHGDEAKELLDHIPGWRSDHVVYFNPTDYDYPIGLNLLGKVPPENRHLVASGVVSAFKGLWSDSWGPRMEYILYNAVAALLDCEHATILGITRMLSDDAYRSKITRKVKDPMIKWFWLKEYEAYDPRFRREIIAPIQNKIGRFLTNAPIRNVLGQVKSTINLRFMMDNRRIFIANLSKGKLGEDKSSLLGSLLTVQFQLAAMQRAEIPEEDRVDFHLYIDEFQNFTTDAFASILSEARKYRLNLTLAHQYLDQLNEGLKAAVFGNVGTLIAFKVGNRDAQILAEEFAPLSPQAFYDLSSYAVWMKLLQYGQVSDPMLVDTHPPLHTGHGRREKLIRLSRERFGRPRAGIEAKIEKWLRC
jgi:hypothetical protein